MHLAAQGIRVDLADQDGSWWRELDSNQRTLGDQIYSLADLTTLPSLHGTRANAV